MKTLEQIEPRTPVSLLPFTISKPGSYYFTTNLIGVVGTNGITISSDDVTLDLNGFALVGVPGSLTGIDVSSIQRNIEIRNGIVRSWGQHGVGARNAQNSMLVRLRAFTNGWESAFGDGLRIGDNSLVKGCVAEANKDDGIFASDSCTVSECAAYSNGDAGIVAFRGSTVTSCATHSNGDEGISGTGGNVIRGCTAHSNGTSGISVGSDGSSTVTDCTTHSNGGTGIMATIGCTISDCTARGNKGDGIFSGGGSTVSGCVAIANEANGIQIDVRSIVRECTASSNYRHGIRAPHDCRIVNNSCVQNGNAGEGAGIYSTGFGSRIDGNTVIKNDRGIDVDNDANFIVRNSASQNGTNYVITGVQTIGPIVTATGTISNFNPWANFSF